MNDPFHEVPALPASMAVGVAVLAAVIILLRARGHLTWRTATVAVAVSVYAAGVIANSVFPIYLDYPTSGRPWTPRLAWVPFADYELDDALSNIAVFVPLGILIPLMLRRPTWRRTIASAAAASVGIELLQLAVQRPFHGGHIADINDLIFNIAGGAVGYAIYRAATRRAPLARLAQTFSWNPPNPTRESSAEPTQHS